MSELNLATILNNTLYAVLDAYTKPLVDRITGLESQADEDMARIAVLEQRLNDTENKLTNTRALLLELSNRMAEHTQAQPAQEGTPLPDAERIEAMVNKAVHDAIEAHMENIYHMTEGDVGQIADDKLSEHGNDYDHDQFITEIDEDAVRDAVRDCLEDARVSISVR